MKLNINESWNQFRKKNNFTSTKPSDLLLAFNSFYNEIKPEIDKLLLIKELPVDDKIVQFVPAIRMMVSDKEIKIIRTVNNSLIEHFSQNKEIFEQISKPVTPGEILDNITTAIFLENNEPEILIDKFLKELKEYRKRYGFDPNIIVAKGAGLIAISHNAKSLNRIIVEFEKKLQLIYLADSSLNFLTKDEIEQLGKQNDKQEIQGKVHQKVIIITGGAQGFGGGIAEDMFEQQANLIVADINKNIGNEFVNKLNERGKNNSALFIKTDVSDAISVQNMIYETVKYYGGIDILISNAGILKAGSLEEMTPEIFEMVTKVNYSGYFHCAKYASEVMKLQSKYKPGYFTDIIQINSKSGLKGSNKNFAYAGSKFGGIGLTQSFALELIPYKIKVNSICPGNFFDGPLWSDPKNGLFVQYFKAGKVPGAKTIANVKRYYEEQVPAKRGCKVNDVMKAIYYVIDQEYETGQAVPVTGGQNMIS